MKLVLVGAGYVGLVSGACFAALGHNVVVLDHDKTKVDALRLGEIPIYEPGLDDMVKKAIAAGLLSFDTDYTHVQGADAVFLAVGTPTRRGDGYADLSYVYKALDDMAPYLNKNSVVVTKSTVPVGTGADIAKRLLDKLGFAVSVVSNPEFLREGSAIEDFMQPSRIVCGIENAHSHDVMRGIYKTFIDKNVPLLFTNLESSEMIKYAANSFLAIKVAFTNEVAQLCEKAGAHIESVMQGVGLDPRISPHFLKPGPGYGGSCFPKDTRAFCQLAQFLDLPLHTVNAAVKANDDHMHFIFEHVRAALGGSLSNKTIGIWGIAFKAGTDDVRESPSLAIAEKLVLAGAKLHIYDPEGMGNAQSQLKEAVYEDSALAASKGADAVLLLTEWPVFKGQDFKAVKTSMKGNVFLDYRHLLCPETMKELGFAYSAFGNVKHPYFAQKLEVV